MTVQYALGETLTRLRHYSMQSPFVIQSVEVSGHPVLCDHGRRSNRCRKGNREAQHKSTLFCSGRWSNSGRPSTSPRTKQGRLIAAFPLRTNASRESQRLCELPHLHGVAINVQPAAACQCGKANRRQCSDRSGCGWRRGLDGYRGRGDRRARWRRHNVLRPHHYPRLIKGKTVRRLIGQERRLGYAASFLSRKDKSLTAHVDLARGCRTRYLTMQGFTRVSRNSTGTPQREGRD